MTVVVNGHTADVHIDADLLLRGTNSTFFVAQSYINKRLHKGFQTLNKNSVTS